MISHRSSLLAIAVVLFSPFMAAAESESAWYNNTTIESDITMVVQNSMGNDYGEQKDQTDFSFTADIMLSGKVSEHSELVFHLEAGSGHSMNENVPSATAVNYDSYATQIEGQTSLNISQAYYQSAFADDRVVFAVGLMDVHSLTDTNEFAGDETSLFLNGVFVRSTGVVFHELANYYAPTLYLQVKPVPFLSLTLTYASPDGHDITGKNQIVGQLGLHPSINERQGNYLFGYILHKEDFTKIIDESGVTNSGYFISVDQQLTDMIGLFVRYAEQDDTIAENTILAATTGGLVFSGMMDNEGNAVGLGYGYVEFNPNLVTEYNEGEDLIEAFVRFGTGDKSQLTLDFQYFTNLNRDTKRSVMVGGIRFQTWL